MVETEFKGRLLKIFSAKYPKLTAYTHHELDDIIELKYPLVKFEDLILSDSLTGSLQRIFMEHTKIDLLKSHKIQARKKLLFYGTSGCGKTMSAHVLASELKLPLFTIRLCSLVSYYKEESSSKLRLIFDSMNNFRAVYLFDDFDVLNFAFPDFKKIELSSILHNLHLQLEKFESKSLVIVSTHTINDSNFYFLKDFDDIIHFKLPVYNEILSFFFIRTRKV